MAERHATTLWEASAACVLLASTLSNRAAVALTSTSAPPAKTPASLAAPTLTGATSVAALLDTSELDRDTVSQDWAFLVAAPPRDKMVKRMKILCLLRPAMNVRSTAFPKRDASVVAPTQQQRALILSWLIIRW